MKMDHPQIKDNKKKLLIAQGISFLLHLIVIMCLHHSAINNTRQSSKKGELLTHLKNPNQFLKEAFCAIESISLDSPTPSTEQTKEKLFEFTSDMNLGKALPHYMKDEAIESFENLKLLEIEAKEPTNFMKAPKAKHDELLSEIEKAKLYPQKSSPQNLSDGFAFEPTTAFKPTGIKEHFRLPPITLNSTQKNKRYTTLLVKHEPVPTGEDATFEIKPKSPELPTLSDLKTVSCGDDFNYDLVYFQARDGEYIFALTVLTKPSIQYEKINQNVYFVVDQSNAIQKRRLKLTGSAIYQSLSYLGETDRFNILTFDSSLIRFAHVPLENTQSARLDAKHFLHHLQLGSLFSRSNMFKPLNSLLFENIDDNELSTIILLTNGESLSNKNASHQFIKHFSLVNDHQFNLHAVSLSGDGHLNLLEALAHLNGGELITSPTHGGVKRKLLKLMKTISRPIAKDIHINAVQPEGNQPIILYPPNHRTKALYEKEPFVVIGKSKSLDDFIFFMQGKHNDEWLNIKKKISFSKAQKASSFLETEWALERAYNFYEEHFQTGHYQPLQEANDLLADYKLPPIF